MCSYSAFLLSYAPFFCGVKIVFFPLFITVSRYYDMYTQGGVTMTCIRRAVLHVYAGRCYIYALYRTPKGVPFPKGTVCPKHVWGTCPVQPYPFGNPIFSLIVHAYSCYQSENISFLCLLKRVIDPSVLNHLILYDNNAIRITCQEVFVDFLALIKYDMLTNNEESNERSGYNKLWSIMKRK